MDRLFKRLGLLATILIMITLFGSVYFVPEQEQVVVTQFGRPVGEPVTEPGLHFKYPFIQRVRYFEKRLLNWDGAQNQIPTKDKKYIWVDTTARWKIEDALLFLQSVGREREAQGRLDDIINSATRDVITENLLIESVRDSNRMLREKAADEIIAITDEALEEISLGRKSLEEKILKRASELAPLYGIHLIDVRIKRLNYVEEVRKRVYERMISERRRVAERYRSEGRGRAAEIEGLKARELDEIRSEAYREAQMILGEADAKATDIYAESYNKDPEFYYFMRTLETYEDTIDENTTVILSTDGDYYRFLDQMD